MRAEKSPIALVVLFLFVATAAFGFGKNKINFIDFKWKYYKVGKFEFYYYEQEKELVQPVIDLFLEAYEHHRRVLKHELQYDIPVVLYKNHFHFEQTNIAPWFIPLGVGGFAEISKLRVVIPINGSRERLRELVYHELCHSFQYDILFNSRLTQLISKAPQWIMEGMCDYLSDDWSAQGNMVVWDAAVNDKIPSLEDLADFSYLPSPYVGYKLGQWAVKYIIDNYGMDAYLNFLWRLKKNLRMESFLDEACKEAFGVKLKELSDSFIKHVKKRAWQRFEEKEDPATAYGDPLLKDEQGATVFAPAFSPSGELMAVFYTKRNKIDIDIFPAKGGKPIKSITESFGWTSYLGIIDQGHPIAWSPDGDYIAFIARQDSGRILYIVNILNNQVHAKVKIPYPSARSVAFSPDGERILFAAENNKGSPEIFTYNRAERSFSQITNDEFYDDYPIWMPNGKAIVYSSERDGYFKLVYLSLEDNSAIQLTFGEGNDIYPVCAPDGKSIYYISDSYDNTYNLFCIDLESEQIRQLTDVFTGIEHPAITPDGKKIAFSTYYSSMYHVHTIEVPQKAKKTETIDSSTDQPGKVNLFDKPPDGKKPPFRLLPDENLMVEVGISSGGIFTGNTQASFSDIMGNHRLVLLGVSEAGYQTLNVYYQYIRYRWDFFSGFSDGDRIYYTYGDYYIRQDRSITAGIQYPLNIFYRTGFFLYHQRTKAEFYYQSGSKIRYQATAATINLTGDTALYSYFGPISGYRFQIDYSRSIYSPSETDMDFSELTVDARKYLRLSKRSLFAVRAVGAFSYGDDRLFYSIGGSGTVRGIDWASLTGTRVAFVNFELRFPFIDILQLPLGIRITGLRGNIFWDVGAAWFDSDEFKPTEKQDGHYRFQDAKSSVGYGIRFDIGPFELWFDFAHRFDLVKVDPDTRYEFSIGRKF